MKAHEHRSIGDEATGCALVDLGGGLSLRHGDVIALSGDFFVAHDADDGLFRLAAVPGDRGLLPGSRDEIVCALNVMAVDEGVAEPRLADGGAFAGYRFSRDVERRVRDRFLALAAVNADHFLAPWADGVDPGPSAVSHFGSARAAYRRLHQVALDEACRLGRRGGHLATAMAREAAAQHYLTDAFASGHVRTPIGAIRRFWHDRYPRFWDSLQRKVASDTAAALRNLAPLLRLLPSQVLHDRTLAAVQIRTAGYPPVSLGDLLGRVFHDWDNDHGLVLESGQLLYGDGHLHQGVGRSLALAAVRAGNDDVEVAYALGRSGTRLAGEPLYERVREASSTGGHGFAAERHLPRLSPDNPPLNWRAGDVDELWSSPIAGSTGPTVGEAVAQVLEPGGEVARRLESLGRGIEGALGTVNVPLLRGWLAGKACHAYQHGFLGGLARDPWASLNEVVQGAGGSSDAAAPVVSAA